MAKDDKYGIPSPKPAPENAGAGTIAGAATGKDRQGKPSDQRGGGKKAK